MKSKIRILGATTALLFATALASCGGNEEVVTIWGPEEHETVYLEAMAKFKEDHPDFKATIKFAALGDAGANGNISKDVETAAEIYTFPNDQLIDLRSMGALGKLPSASVEKIKKEHYLPAVESGKFGDDYYAYPLTADNGFVFIFNRAAFKDTSVWDATKDNNRGGLKAGYTFRDLYKALDEKGAEDPKWKNSICIWPSGTAWYQCGIYFATGGDYNVTFDDAGTQIKSECNFAWEYKKDSSGNPTDEIDYTKGIEAVRCMVNSITDETGKISDHFVFADDNTYNSIANNNSLPAEFTKEGGKPLAGIVCWNNGNLLTNWGDDYDCEVLPTLVSDTVQYGGTGNRYTWRSFSGFKLMGVNPFSAFARKSEQNLLLLHEIAQYLTGYDASIARFDASSAGPSNLQAREADEIKTNRFMVKLTEQLNLTDNQGNNIGYRTQDCVPQNFWTPIATLGNGVYNYIANGQNPSSFKNVTALELQLYNMQKSITTTI